MCCVVALLAVVAAPRIADACQDRVRSPTIAAKEVAAHGHIYVVRVTKVVKGQPDSRYMPPFEFEGRIVLQLRGALKPGAVVLGQTTSQRFRSECPAMLVKGQTYLLFLNGATKRKRRLVLQRFGARIISARVATFHKAVARVRQLVKRSPRRK